MVSGHVLARLKPCLAGMVGQPNVGKSTIINSLVGKSVVSTSQTPGHTKHFQAGFGPGMAYPTHASAYLSLSFVRVWLGASRPIS
jgi:hypothetical protein